VSLSSSNLSDNLAENTAAISSNKVAPNNYVASHSVVDMGVQTQLNNTQENVIKDSIESASPTSSNKCVEELRQQLDSLKSEIGRLQSAQSNLEKSLKSQASVAFRPIVLSDFDAKNGWYSLK
jgi:hypothetical protein